MGGDEGKGGGRRRERRMRSREHKEVEGDEGGRG